MQIQTTSQSWGDLLRTMSIDAGHTDTLQTGQAVLRKSTQIAQAASGCNHARTVILHEIQDPCYRFCLTQLACPDQASDATQETALRVLRSLGRFRGEASLTTWALSIALNVCREQRRRRRWFSLPVGFATADPTPQPPEQAGRSEQNGQLLKALQALPARQREAVTLRYLHGLSTTETAIAMNCAEGTVKATLAKALGKLREHWGQRNA